VVVGDRLIVVGGWRMSGTGKEPGWHDTALVLDLAKKDARWEPVKQPFQRRALTAAAFQDKVFVIAGLTPDAKTHLTVNVYDPAKGTWTTGPDIPAGPMNGFTPASCACGGRLYVSTADGKVWRLTEKGDAWEEVGQLKEPRFVHRLVAAGKNRLLAVGGASKKGNVALTEANRPNDSR
jgi:N-acetylneuraminic acid mutarotase